ncbi:MAG: AAA family ATPase [Nanoarchaeota archaeon]
MVVEIEKIFESFDENNIFKDKSVLQTNYQPKEIIYRDEQIKLLASMLAPVLRGERPSNLFLYGKTGTGKTLSIQYIRQELLKRMKKDADFKLRIEYRKCSRNRITYTSSL